MGKDAFVSHASEDKDFVDELVRALNSVGVTTWYDTQDLKVGDSLREKIDEGLANSSHGVVVLSHAFFAKQWPREELDGLFARRTSDGSLAILPIWHGVSRDEVAQFSPMLAGKFALLSSTGAETVALRIRESVRASDSVFPKSHSHGRRYLGQTLRVIEIPRAFGAIQDTHFEKCHFTGPAVLALQGSNHFERFGVPSLEVLFPLPIDRRYAGMILVRECTFLDCVFEDIGFGVPADSYDALITSLARGSTHYGG